MKKPLKPITIEVDSGTQVTLQCKHKDVWPPIHAFLGETFDDLRAAGDIDDHKYQQLQVWQKTCGLKNMSADKCPTCPLALVQTDGAPVPYVDQTGTKPAHPPSIRSKSNVRRR